MTTVCYKIYPSPFIIRYSHPNQTRLEPLNRTKLPTPDSWGYRWPVAPIRLAYRPMWNPYRALTQRSFNPLSLVRGLLAITHRSWGRRNDGSMVRVVTYVRKLIASSIPRNTSISRRWKTSYSIHGELTQNQVQLRIRQTYYIKFMQPIDTNSSYPSIFDIQETVGAEISKR